MTISGHACSPMGERAECTCPPIPFRLSRLHQPMRRPAAGAVSRRRFARGMIPVLAGTIAVTLPWAWRAVLPADFGPLIRCRASAERIGRRYLATLADDID